MIERIALLVTLSLAAIAAYYLVRAAHLRRIQSAAPAPAAPSRPSLLYFRGDSCPVCPAQGRILEQLAGQWAGQVTIRRIDAEREPETAARYRVFTLPTTLLLDGEGRVRQVNYGLADERKLGRQVEALLERPPTTDGRPKPVEIRSQQDAPASALLRRRSAVSRPSSATSQSRLLE